MVYTEEDLRAMQKWSLARKIQVTQSKIIEYHSRLQGQVYVSFSGGKDSTVLLDIARKIYPDIEAVFIDTGLEYPEIKEFVKTIPNVIWVKPAMTFNQVVEKEGFPIISKEISYNIEYARKNKTWAINRLNGKDQNGVDNPNQQGKMKYKYLVEAPFKISSKCCDILKKRPAKKFEKESGKHPIVGTMASEGGQRKTAYKTSGCNSFEGLRPMSTPMGFWTEQDVLTYLLTYLLPYSSIYGDIIKSNGELITTGVQRTGCMFCMFGCHLEKEPNRFQKLQISHPQIYDYCINKLNLKEPLEYIGIPYKNDQITIEDILNML